VEPQGFGSVCIFCVHIVFTIILTKLPLDRVPVIRYTAVMPSKIFTRVGFPLIAISFCCVVSTLKFNPGVILVVVFTSDRISPGCLHLSYDFVWFSRESGFRGNLLRRRSSNCLHPGYDTRGSEDLGIRAFIPSLLSHDAWYGVLLHWGHCFSSLGVSSRLSDCVGLCIMIIWEKV